MSALPPSEICYVDPVGLAAIHDINVLPCWIHGTSADISEQAVRWAAISPFGSAAAVPCSTSLDKAIKMKLSTSYSSTGRVISIETDPMCEERF
jgi:hypothetical protein